MKRVIFFKFSLLVLICLTVFFSCKKENDIDNPDVVNLDFDLLVNINFDNGTCNDISGHNYHGVINGNIQFVRDTPTGTGQSVMIDGTQKQSINLPFELMPDSSGFTLTGWFKNFGTGPLFTSLNSDIASPGIYVTSDSKLDIFYRYGERKEMSTSLIGYQASGWHMITVTGKSSKEVILYIDGKRVDSNSIGSVVLKGKKLQIGGNADGISNAWADPMLVDNIRVYGRSIKEKEVAELYLRESGRNGGVNMAPTTRSLLAYYTFDDGTANNVHLNGCNGVLVNESDVSKPLFISDTPNSRGKSLYLLSEQYVNIVDNILKGKGALSIGMWVKNFGTGPLFSTVNSSDFNSPSLVITSDCKLRAYYRYSEYKTIRTSMEQYQSSGWNHIVVTMSFDNVIVLYINGVRIDSEPIGSIVSNGNSMMIGGKVEYSAWADPMMIDNVRIHGVALTDAEVAAIYDAEKK